jgi:sugar O-acyltransferase (sialic acid O-acetyltransferase NeuD family)
MSPSLADLLIIGAGGHARVIADALLLQGVAVAGLVAPALAGEVFDLPLLGDDESLAALAGRGLRRAALGIGDNHRRRQAAARARAAGLTLACVCHPQAILGRDVVLGAGAGVLAGAVINAGARVGEGAIVNSLGLVEHDAVVGAYAHIAPGARVLGGVVVGAEALVGAGAVVLPGVRVGARAVIGAGAVVLADVPAGALVTGVPGRVRPRRTSDKERFC